MIRARQIRAAQVGLIVALALGAALPVAGQNASPMTLHQAVTLAVQNSRDVKLAQVQYNVALGEVGVQKAAFLPNIYTGAGGAYTHGFPSLPGGGAPAIFQVSYTEALFNPLLKSQQQAAEERANTQKLELDRTRENVMIRAATSYLELAKVRHSLDLLQKEQVSGEKILQLMRERIAANQELPIEGTRSELELARIRQRLVKIEDREQVLEAQLRDMTGTPDSQSLDVEADETSFDESLAADTAAIEADLVSLALQNDRNVAEAQNERAAREKLTHGARWAYFPTIDAVGQYSLLSKFNNYGEFYKNFEPNSVNVGIEITIPLFAAKTGANNTLAKRQFDEAEVALSNTIQKSRFDIQQKSQNLRELEADREVARLDLQLAQENLQLEQAKFDQGRVTLQEMERARLDESDKWVAFLDADFARQQAQLTLLQATGQLAKVFQ